MKLNKQRLMEMANLTEGQSYDTAKFKALYLEMVKELDKFEAWVNSLNAQEVDQVYNDKYNSRFNQAAIAVNNIQKPTGSTMKYRTPEGIKERMKYLLYDAMMMNGEGIQKPEGGLTLAKGWDK
tara:strand:- start:61 stop:432 length:372 start_codon:yes stop_codon:yes gene_type:complete